MTNKKVFEELFEELKRLFDEYGIDYDEDNFYENYLSFIDGIMKINLGLENVDKSEINLTELIISDLLSLLRSLSE